MKLKENVKCSNCRYAWPFSDGEDLVRCAKPLLTKELRLIQYLCVLSEGHACEHYSAKLVKWKGRV